MCACAWGKIWSIFSSMHMFEFHWKKSHQNYQGLNVRVSRAHFAHQNNMYLAQIIWGVKMQNSIKMPTFYDGPSWRKWTGCYIRCAYLSVFSPYMREKQVVARGGVAS